MFGIAYRDRGSTIGTLCVIGLLLGSAGAGPVGATTLKDYFDDNNSSFAEGDLTFSDFKPVLKDGAVQSVWNTIQSNPSALSTIEFLDFNTGVFSQGLNNASAADAAQIDLTPLGDDSSTPFFDPGFQLSSPPASSPSDPSTWRVDAGNTASVQVSAFSYVVTTSDPATKPITSAGLSQEVVIEAIGPDVWPPDLATALTFQFVMLPGSEDPFPGPGNPAVWNNALDVEIRNFVSISSPFSWVDTAVLNEPNPVMAVKVVSVTALGASSGGIVRMDSLDHRIDPPNPNAPSVIPESETALLFLTGMLGMGAMRRRRS